MCAGSHGGVVKSREPLPMVRAVRSRQSRFIAAVIAAVVVVCGLVAFVSQRWLSNAAFGNLESEQAAQYAQRVKIATELSRLQRAKHTVYILDEPTTGLHLADVQRLLDALSKLADAGHTVIVIEHHLDVIKTADHVIDLGPEGGHAGGEVVAIGTPEAIVRSKASHTGRFLAPLLGAPSRPVAVPRKTASGKAASRRTAKPKPAPRRTRAAG